MCKKVSVCLKCVFASRIDFSLNLVPLYDTTGAPNDNFRKISVRKTI